MHASPTVAALRNIRLLRNLVLGRLSLREMAPFHEAKGDISSRVRRLGLPDRFIEHGERGELLADLGLNPPGIAAACRELVGQVSNLP